MSESRSRIDINLVIASATWAAVVVAFLGAVWQREDARLQREDARSLVQAQFISSLDSEFNSVEMRKARKAFAAELRKNPNGRKLTKEDRVLDFFEKVGTYHRLGRIDDETTYSAFSDLIENYWVAAEGRINALRADSKNDGYYGDFEGLNKWALEEDAKAAKRPTAEVRPTPQEVKEFLESEANLTL